MPSFNAVCGGGCPCVAHLRLAPHLAFLTGVPADAVLRDAAVTLHRTFQKQMGTFRLVFSLLPLQHPLQYPLNP